MKCGYGETNYTRLAGATVNKREGVATGARGEFNGQHIKEETN